MRFLTYKRTILVVIMSILLLTGCSDSSDKQTFDERIWQTYSDNGRLDKYNELKDDYGNIKAIILLNQNTDSMWITNSTLWLIFSILPDVPDFLAGGGVIGIIYLIAWWLGVALTGGGILAVLAWVGAQLYVLPGIPAAIMGIVYLGAMFAMLSNLFGLLF